MNKKDNILCYYNTQNDKFMTYEEHDKLLKEFVKTKNMKYFNKIKNYVGVVKNDKYYIFFEERIKSILAKQIEMEI